jgi:CRISPR-associated endonuclease/helicase Cas3
LGKTSVVAIWLIALANYADRMPRRLVYVVNRRTVVDQTTNEVEKYRARLDAAGLKNALAQLCSITSGGNGPPLALSTLRGQFADNREWSADPCRPAVISGTVDMIGSRLLFSGYGVGFKAKPLHAGFLGQDALLVHDEAHLEPAFQKLLVAIRDEQTRSGDSTKFHLMELSATSRTREDERTADDGPFELTVDERSPPSNIPDPPTAPLHHVWRRLKAKKGIRFFPVKRDEVAKKIGERARDRWKESGKAVLVFVRTIDDVKTVQQILTDKKLGVPADQVQVLTGTQRGLERDRMATKDRVFARFVPEPQIEPMQGTVYLVCTSAGEVGVDISADHMVCDLSTLDSMAQRLGRVNRRGDGTAEVDVFFESDPDSKTRSPDFEKARCATFAILQRLPRCDWADSHGEQRQEASPLELRNLNLTDEERRSAFAPPPTILPVSDILFDAWALTTIRNKLPGRPPVEPYLHGISSWDPPRTQVAWREEVGVIIDNLRETYDPEDLLDDYPLKPHELLQDISSRVFDRLKKLDAPAETPVWIVSSDDSVEVATLGSVVEADKEALNYKTILLPPSAGGLDRSGMLTSDSTTPANDVADEWYDAEGRRRRVRVRGNGEQDNQKTKQMRLIRRIEFPTNEDDEDAEVGSWDWYERPASGDGDGSKAARKPVLWEVHTQDVCDNADRLVKALPLEDELKHAISLAARFHDFGKKREVWQRSIGNPVPTKWLAKAGNRMRPRSITDYRHEFGSLLDILEKDDFKRLNDKPELQDLILHLIATHHGRGRPHFQASEVVDQNHADSDAARLAQEVPRRFARLQRKYGRWGLAYLESLLRAADWAASAHPSAFFDDGGEEST